MTKNILGVLIITSFSTHALAEKSCQTALLPNGKMTYKKITEPIVSNNPLLNMNLSDRYGIKYNQLQRTPELGLPVIFRMSDHDTLAPQSAKNTTPVKEKKKYDVVIVGGGPAGLTSALYLAEAGKSVLVLERNEQLGGLGAGSTLKNISAGGGAAYSAGPDGGLAYKVFQKIGLGNYKKKISIEEPIDSYLWNGKLYKGIWEEHTLKELPASFALFKHALLELCDKGANGDSTPIARWADNRNMAELVRLMPDLVATWSDRASIEVLKHFQTDPKVNRADPMKDVIDLLDLYGRSALGGPAAEISARQFLDFYESEIFTRYTGTLGTGTVSQAILKKLAKYPNLVEMRTSTPVSAIENMKNSTKTLFIEGETLKEVEAKKVIFAAPMTLAPKLIKNLNTLDPEKTQEISQIKMTDYAVHVVRVKGHPYRDTYDTWVHNDNNPNMPTDYILGRWQDPKINSYHGQRNFKKSPEDDYGVISIYHPLGISNKGNFANQNHLKMVDEAVANMLEKLAPLVEKNGQKIEIELVESYRWPYSIHIVGPGYLAKIPILARPTGNIHYANNTVAAPELESAMERGAREAMSVLKRLRK